MSSVKYEADEIEKDAKRDIQNWRSIADPFSGVRAEVFAPDLIDAPLYTHE